jgi:hypothetical protein
MSSQHIQTIFAEPLFMDPFVLCENYALAVGCGICIGTNKIQVQIRLGSKACREKQNDAVVFKSIHDALFLRSIVEVYICIHDALLLRSIVVFKSIHDAMLLRSIVEVYVFMTHCFCVPLLCLNQLMTHCFCVPLLRYWMLARVRNIWSFLILKPF